MPRVKGSMRRPVVAERKRVEPRRRSFLLRSRVRTPRGTAPERGRNAGVGTFGPHAVLPVSIRSRTVSRAPTRAAPAIGDALFELLEGPAPERSGRGKSSMIELRTLGTLSLRASDGREVESLLAHTKRAGLLTYLSTARPRGFHRRDALLALFWPELDQERARTSLRKAVFQIRRSLGDDVIVGRGDEELRVADHLVWCDARALDEALDSGDAEGAIALYGGKFLDAFFVPDALGFERWMDEERSRLHGRAFDATWQLAVRDEQAGNTFGAASWARRATALAPHDECAVRRLIELLDRQGDRAGALHVYDDFARRLAAEFEVEPSAETQALIQAVRSREAPAAKAPAKEPERDVRPAAVAATLVADLTAPALAPATGRALSIRAVVAGLAALVVAAAGATALAWRRSPPPVADTPNVVAVFPFTVRGERSVGYLREGMASLLAMALDGAGDLRSVDPQAILARPGARNDGAPDPTTASAVAATLGAGRWILGDVVESNGRLRINAALYDRSKPGGPILLSSAESTTDSVFPLVDRLAAQLLAGPRGDSTRAIARVAALTTHSLPALKSYLEGEIAFRKGDFRQALGGFQDAVRLDSTFALAHYRLASAYSWSGSDSAGPVAERAVRLSDRLSPSLRELLQAFHLFETGQVDSAERRYRAILARRPEDVEAQFQLGEVMFHGYPARGRPSSAGRPFFARAAAFNDGDPPVIHLMELIALDRDYAAFDSLLPRIKSGSHFWLAGQMVHAFTTGDERARKAVEADVRNARDIEFATIGAHALFLLDDSPTMARVVRILDDPNRPNEIRLVSRLLSAHVSMAAGRWREAGRWLDSAAVLDPVRAAEHAALLHAVPAFPIPQARLEEVRAMIERAAPLAGPRPDFMLTTGDEAIHASLMAYALAITQARLGRDVDEARIVTLADRSARGPAAALPAYLANGARAQVLLAAGKAAQALRTLEAIPPVRRNVDLMGYSPFTGLRHERFLRGEALRRLGRLEEADLWFSSFAEHSPYGRLDIAAAHLRRAEIAERLGRSADAAEHRKRVAVLWKDAEPEFRALVTGAADVVAR